MFWKLVVVLVSVVLIGAGLLGLRAERQHLKQEIAQLHAEVDQARHRTWDAQVRIAERAAPTELRPALERAGLELEPAVPTELRWPEPGSRQMVEADAARR